MAAFLCIFGALMLAGGAGSALPLHAVRFAARPDAVATVDALQPLTGQALLGAEGESSLLAVIRPSSPGKLVGTERGVLSGCLHWRSGTWVADWCSCWLQQFDHSLIARHVRLQI